VNLFLLFPEWVVFGTLLLMIVCELVFPKASLEEKKSSKHIAFVGAWLAFFSVLPFAGKIDVAFGGMFILDPFALFFKTLLSLSLVVIIQMSEELFTQPGQKPGEFFLILWTAFLGMFFLVSSNDLLLLFISLEIVTLSFYVMVSYLKREMPSIEAGLKYLILGSVASAFIIFGISLLYIAAGSTSLPNISDTFEFQPRNPLMILGFLMMAAGLGFKMSAFPFQFWVPDVYQGAPTPVAAFLSVGSKAVGFAVLLRLLFTVFAPLAPFRPLFFAIVAALTLLYGNLGALVQTNMKRLFGYSSVSHAGYLLIGIAVGQMAGISALLYYFIAYAFANLAAFLVITIVGSQTKNDQIEAFRGLAKRSPLLAGVMFLSLVSLAGVPPLAGFFGKFLVLLAAVKNHLGWLALLGALLVAVALYYYLSIVRVMYIEEPLHEEPLKVSRISKVLLIALSIGILVVGLWQAPWMAFAETTARYLF
jgi:NADH-quinone oxidoreductase subunit N